MSSLENLGSALRALRRRKGLSQAEAAQRLGVHPSQVSRWERGGFRRMQIGSLERLLDVYGAGFADLAAALEQEEREREVDALFASVLDQLHRISHPTIPQPEAGRRFRALRESSGWSLEEVAERVSLPLALLEAFEQGEDVEISGPDLRAMAEACCGTLSDVLPHLEEKGRGNGGGKAIDPHG